MGRLPVTSGSSLIRSMAVDYKTPQRVYAAGSAGLLKPKSPLRMPAFGDKLSDAEIRAVIEFMKSYWSPNNRQYQFDETRKDFAPTPTPQ
jgi:mono/diheme cytochrome c family protein